MFKIESLLSARLFLNPQLVGERIYFISNISGRMSLYAMDYGGSIPEPLLPPDIALQNPHLIGGDSFYVFPKLGKILVSIDQDGNEIYKPMLIPLDGGYPTPLFENELENFRVEFGGCDPDKNITYFFTSSLVEANNITYRVNLRSGEMLELARNVYGLWPDGNNENHSKVILNEGYSSGDHVIYLWDEATNLVKLIYGKPMGEREDGENVPLNSIDSLFFIRNEEGLVFHTTLFDDRGGLGYINLLNGGEIQSVTIEGELHSGSGEFNGFRHLDNERYAAFYNIDGSDWVYEGVLDEESLSFRLHHVICGQGEISNGVLEHLDYEKATDRFVLSYSTATSPTQIYTIEGKNRQKMVQHTRERILALPESLLAVSEDASYTSFDGLRISARLYMPAEDLGFSWSPSARLLYPRWATEPGTTRLCLVLHAFDSISHAQRICCICSECKG